MSGVCPAWVGRTLFGTLAFLLGGGLAGFAALCRFRLLRGMSVAFPPSSCPACGRTLSWMEKFPICGYLVVRGRCASCRLRLSVVEWLVEAAVGLVAAAGLQLFFA